MADIINQGWCDISSGTTHLHVYFQQCIVDYVVEPLKLMHEVAGINMGIGGGKKYLIFNVKNVFLTSHSDFSDFVDYLKDWQYAGAFTLGIRRDGSNSIQWDGDNTSFTVMLKSKIGGMEKVNFGSTDGVYCISNLVFEQAG